MRPTLAEIVFEQERAREMARPIYAMKADDRPCRNGCGRRVGLFSDLCPQCRNGMLLRKRLISEGRA
jgi:hypothetical protein